MALNVHTQYRQVTSGLHNRTIAGITVLLRESWEQPLVLNNALHLVWTCLEVVGSADDITADIVDVFGQDSGSVRGDVEEAFRQLDEVGLIEPVDVADAAKT